jgi:hypothetical protein
MPRAETENTMTAVVINLREVRKAREPEQASPTELSFVVDRKNGRKRLPRCFWNVQPTRRYSADLKTGRHLALEYLRFCQRGNVPLAWIIMDMPRQEDRSGIDIGFLSVVGDVAASAVKVFGMDKLELHVERIDRENEELMAGLL